ncbi:MAG: cytochrome C oxidase subunit IV family protein [Thermomicrobiales bacterium]|mgnify:CR=1 FL=1
MASHAMTGHADESHAAHEGHPSNPVYIRIAIILAIITFIEVVIYYVPAFRPALVPALLVLSIAKFLMVVGFFMHLKFDNKLFRFMFAAGLVLTLAVYFALLAMVWTTPYWAPLLAG